MKIRNPNYDNTEIMIAYGSHTADSEVHIFERDEKGDLKPVDTNQKYPPKIIENGQENNILPAGVTDLGLLKERQKKLERVLELQKTIEVYQGKTHIVETLSGSTVGMIEGSAVRNCNNRKCRCGSCNWRRSRRRRILQSF